VIVEEILLDTNVLLRFLFEPERLPADVVERIADGRNRVWFSILSLWEIAIKQALRRDEFDFAPENVNALAVETALFGWTLPRPIFSGCWGSPLFTGTHSTECW
jgi:PIN domain nuclease of toxin-antitoxin system